MIPKFSGVNLIYKRDSTGKIDQVFFQVKPNRSLRGVSYMRNFFPEGAADTFCATGSRATAAQLALRPENEEDGKKEAPPLYPAYVPLCMRLSQQEVHRYLVRILQDAPIPDDIKDEIKEFMVDMRRKAFQHNTFSHMNPFTSGQVTPDDKYVDEFSDKLDLQYYYNDFEV